MSETTYKMLFICTGNSARSAGSHPCGEVHPLALATRCQHPDDINSLRSKSWDEFANFDAPRMVCIFTVCDTAASQHSPIWPGQLTTAHRSVIVPSRIAGDEETQRHAFSRTDMEITSRLRIVLSLSPDKIDCMSLQHQL